MTRHDSRVPLAINGDLPTASSTRRECRTILFVDDDATLRRVSKRMLERRGYQVWIAANSTDALNILLANPGAIDVVISNVVFARIGETTRYIFTSAQLTLSALGALRSRPGTAFLPKPWTIAQLDASIVALQGQTAEGMRGA